MKIYMDNAATTPVANEVLKAMEPYFSKEFGNPNSLYDLGQKARDAVEESRKIVANMINAKPEEIIFTSGGTESDNLAIKGLALGNENKRHVITTKIEHHAVLETCKWLEKNGYEITYLDVDGYGLVNPEDVEMAIRKDTLLVSVMHANNEIGTIEPIKEIGTICRKKGVYFHTDAVQTIGKIPIDVKEMNIDLLSASSHKIYGPKGVGFLYVRNGIKIEPLIHGGGQENKMRSGTENVAGIIGFGAAIKLAKKNMRTESKTETKLKDYLIKEVMKIPKSYLNGYKTKRLPFNAHFWFSGVEGEAIVMLLDKYGIAASTGSACSSGSLEPSHVLTSIGLNEEQAHGSLRLTIGRQTTFKEIRYTVKALKKIVNKLRKMSPTWVG